MKQELLFRALAELQSVYESQLAFLEKRRSSYPEGFLRLQIKQNIPYFFRVCQYHGKRTEIAIPNQTVSGNHLLQLLLEKHIAYHGRPLLRKNIKAIKKVLSELSVYDPERLLDKWNRADTNLILPDSVFLPRQLNTGKWVADTLAGRYRTNPSHPENLKFKTRQGRRVRSKSEVFWDDALLDVAAVFRYENALALKSGKVIYPDFTVLHPKEPRLVFIEHFGRMDDPRYAMRNMRKLQEYAENGWIPGRDVFFTMETKEQPLTSTQINAILREIGF